MLDELTNQICESCNSPIIVYKSGKELIAECCYCGLTIEEYDNYIKLVNKE